MGLDFQEIKKNVLVAFLAQGIALLLSFLTSLLVPKILGVEQFGYWQLFLFYSGYVGFFHFGLNDGIYLINGGKLRGEIDASSISSQFAVGSSIQIVISLSIVVYAVLDSASANRCFVVIATSIMLVLSNATTFVGYTFQALNETKLFSYSTIIQKVSFLISLAALLLLGCGDFRLYVLGYVIAQAVALLFCVIKGCGLICCKRYSLAKSSRLWFSSVRVGIKLTVANVASMLILGVARLVIDMQWGIETFGQLSLSLSLVNFFLLFVTQVSMVLFPALRRVEIAELKRLFGFLRSALVLMMPAAYLVCFPLKSAMGLWLPQYEESLSYFMLLIPICVFDGQMNLVYSTYFKVLREESILLRVNCAAVAFSAAGSLLSAFVFHSILLISICMVAAIVFRSIISDYLLSKELMVENIRLIIAELCITLLFMILSSTLSGAAASLWYLIGYMAYLVFLRSDAAEVFKRLRHS